jgi:p-cumate 2,3-dioxygenase alpha subunit
MQDARMSQADAQTYIIDNAADQTFKLNRSALVEPNLFELEQRRIFDVCWIYLGHESEITEPGDFKTRNVCGRPIIFARDSAGNLRAFLNSCRHRGAVVCRLAEGNADSYSCFYHGWMYDQDGALKTVPGSESYGPAFDKADFALGEVPNFASYRGFCFVNFSHDAEPLEDYLAGATEYIDLVVDQSPSGKMQVVEGTQEYDIAANWKLLVENSFDDYHLLSTHSTWLGYLKDAGVEMKPPEKGHLLPSHGICRNLGNGHATTDNVNFRGRPVARWIPIYGEDAKEEIDEIRAELVQRLGEKRATRIADTNRNLVVFPNLVLNDGSSITIRTFHPISAGRMQVTAWALGPAEESQSALARRLDSFLTFYGPGGFATPDDVEALEMVQAGLQSWREVTWSDISRGMNKDGEQLNTDELHLRTFWRRWSQYMEGAQS